MNLADKSFKSKIEKPLSSRCQTGLNQVPINFRKLGFNDQFSALAVLLFVAFAKFYFITLFKAIITAEKITKVNGGHEAETIVIGKQLMSG